MHCLRPCNGMGRVYGSRGGSGQIWWRLVAAFMAIGQAFGDGAHVVPESDALDVGGQGPDRHFTHLSLAVALKAMVEDGTTDVTGERLGTVSQAVAQQQTAAHSFDPRTVLVHHITTVLLRAVLKTETKTAGLRYTRTSAPQPASKCGWSSANRRRFSANLRRLRVNRRRLNQSTNDLGPSLVGGKKRYSVPIRQSWSFCLSLGGGPPTAIGVCRGTHQPPSLQQGAKHSAPMEILGILHGQWTRGTQGVGMWQTTIARSGCICSLVEIFLESSRRETNIA